jgi:sugar lactone lactonase YvrE
MKTTICQKALLLLGFSFLLLTSNAQNVGIGTTSPDASAALHVSATNKGMLVPRLTATQRAAIASPATGLLVFQTDVAPGFYYYDGAEWLNMAGNAVNAQGFAPNHIVYNVTTLAGSTNDGHADGQGTVASFSGPNGVAVDAIGNIYVADGNNNAIRKITPAGLVSTIAGGGPTAGHADGQGAMASFYGPTGVAVDASGNIYVADIYNNEIRKITPTGLVTTIAGSTTSGHADGQGTAASFNVPTGIAVDAVGNIYVADYGNNEIRKITPTLKAGQLVYVVSTLAGSTTTRGHTDGQGTVASFNGPAGVAVDASGNIYVADYGNNEIRKITPAGLVSTIAGSINYGKADGQGTTASFNGPNGVAVDASGNIYVADASNNEIRKLTPTGLVSTIAGSTTTGHADGQGAAASFYGPNGVAIDASGNIYVADTYNNEIRKITVVGSL